MTRTAVAFAVMPDAPLEKLVEWAREAEDLGFAGVYMTEANTDSLACSLALGAHTQRIGLGTAISNIYLRHPTLLASEAATVYQRTGGRFVLGLGTGHRESNSRLGIEMGQPLARMRETVATLRRMLDGGATLPKVSGKLPIYLAGVSRPMVRLAGEIADGVIFNFFPPARVREALGEIAEGARVAGRDPAAVKPVLFATAFISDDLEAARRPARTLLSRYGALRFYANMMSKAGFEREIAAISAAGSNAAAALAAVSDAMIDATLLVGPESRVRERLAELCAPGVAEAIVFANPVNEPRESAVRRLMRALRP